MTLLSPVCRPRSISFPSKCAFSFLLGKCCTQMGVVRENRCQLLGCLEKRPKLDFLWEVGPRGSGRWCWPS